MITSPCKRICNTVSRVRKYILCTSLINGPTKNSHNYQLTSCSQEQKEKNEMTIKDVMNIFKNTDTQEFLNNCTKSVDDERATTMQIVSWMQMPPGVNFQETIDILDWWTKLKAAEEQHDQEYDEERVRLYGADSAAAHFFIDRQATVRLKGSKDWIGGGLPSLKRYEQGYFVNAEHDKRDYLVEAIDCSHFHNSGLRFEGLQYLSGLNYLKYLSLQNQKNIDAICLERIASENGSTIEFLDLTGIVLDTECIAAISKIKALKELVVTVPENTNVRKYLARLERKKPTLKLRVMENCRHGKVSTRPAPRPVILQKASSIKI